MSDTLYIVQEVLPLAALIDLLTATRAGAGGARLLARLRLYQELDRRLQVLEAAPMRDDEPILRAHPVSGEIDHAALTREIIARFPKILAALAE